MNPPSQPAIGTTLAGFRIERLIGSGDSGSVFEATQLSLGRQVALRLVDLDSFDDAEAARFNEDQRRFAVLDHPGLVPTYEAGEVGGFRFIAMRYLKGGTLEARARYLSPECRRTLAGALGAAHAGGIAHGRIAPHNILFDERGNVYLADLGLGRAGTVDADSRALATVLSRLGSERRGSRSRARAAATVGSVAALVAGGLALAGSRGEEIGEPPPVPADSAALGSDLAGGPFVPVGCVANPNPNTPACTVAQEGETVEQGGTVRQWAVAGAQGEMALQVVRGTPGQTYVAGFTQPVRVDGGAPQAFAANLQVRAGDQLALKLASGATIGIAQSGGEAMRWDGEIPDTPSKVASEAFAGDLQLRVAIAEGVAPEEAPGLDGPAALRAPAGETLARLVVPAGQNEIARVSLVRVDGAIALDLTRGGARVSRVEVVEASASGRLVELFRCGLGRSFCLRWLNPGSPSALFNQFQLARRATGIRLVG